MGRLRAYQESKVKVIAELEKMIKDIVKKNVNDEQDCCKCMDEILIEFNKFKIEKLQEMK